MVTHLLKTLDGEIELPRWLQRQVNLWIEIPGVEAVVMFGSRANGRAQANSDWDVAVLHEEEQIDDFPVGSEVEAHCVDVPLVSLSEFTDCAYRVGTLAHELATKGKVLAGRFPGSDSRKIVVSEEDLARHLEYAFRELASSIADLPADIRRNRHEPSLTRARAHVSSRQSAEGAERVAKALCVHLGVTYVHSHDVKRLSRLVPREWSGKVLAMDGRTRRALLTAYEGSFEVIRDVIRRISASLDLLGEIVAPSCLQLQLQTVIELEEQVSLSTVMQRVMTYTESDSVHPEIRSLARQMESVKEKLEQHLWDREREIGSEGDIGRRTIPVAILHCL